MPECLFCQIISGQLPAAIVFEDEVSLAFLDRNPLFPGHVLLIPRAHHTTLMDLPSEFVPPLFLNAQRLAQAVELALQAEGIFVGINNRVSQSVAHLHVHIVPRRKGDGLKGFFWPRSKYASIAAMDEAAERIRGALKALAESSG
jgi:histidine triad (HIT) family protein